MQAVLGLTVPTGLTVSPTKGGQGVKREGEKSYDISFLTLRDGF